ncbi:hypothetical protein BDW02DRAFT_493360 [Decorospora gaudefroyi]|uniref:BTB domain-containing protein n=1 Tax=Decorospora gaudefroyi TaxID=184978 RepID=A0A6A5KHH2_9PLEO|nr:hypothetical protein BDW02DRAFT_493360 [Decorospora gaudefroyi]
MAAPTPTPAPQLKPELASLQREKIDPRSARNLLRGAFKQNLQKLTRSCRHMCFLFHTPIDRNFGLITACGVEFNIHSVLLIGGSKMLQEGVFPGGTMPPSPPTFVHLPERFHPILVDRIVSFIYTSDYAFGPRGVGHVLEQKDFEFKNATLIPDGSSPTAATPTLVGIHGFAFHFRIYALAEEMEYDALKSAAHHKLVNILVQQHKKSPFLLKELVNVTFAPSVEVGRICKDEDGVLQQVVIAAIIAHECNGWSEKETREFADSLEHPEYVGFWHGYNMVKEENRDLIKLGEYAKPLAAERKKTKNRNGRKAKKEMGGEGTTKGDGNLRAPLAGPPRQRENKFKKRHEGKRGVGAVPIAAKGREDGNMDLEDDELL